MVRCPWCTVSLTTVLAFYCNGIARSATGERLPTVGGARTEASDEDVAGYDPGIIRSTDFTERSTRWTRASFCKWSRDSASFTDRVQEGQTTTPTSWTPDQAQTRSPWCSRTPSRKEGNDPNKGNSVSEPFCSPSWCSLYPKQQGNSHIQGRWPPWALGAPSGPKGQPGGSQNHTETPTRFQRHVSST